MLLRGGFTDVPLENFRKRELGVELATIDPRFTRDEELAARIRTVHAACSFAIFADARTTPELTLVVRVTAGAFGAAIVAASRQKLDCETLAR